MPFCSTIASLARLEEFHLDSNGLMMLPDEMADMKRLRALYVRHNQLQTLPASLLKDTPVDRMQLEGRMDAAATMHTQLR